MAFLWPKTTTRRIDSSGKKFRMAVTPYGIVASAWPKKRGLPKDSYQKSTLERMTQLVHAQRQMLPCETEDMQKSLDKFKRENRGNMGQATIRFRDLLTQLQSGRLYGLILPGGRKIYHVDALVDITRLLDWLQPRAGGMLVRTSMGWRTTVNCKEGRLFTLQEEGDDTDACPSATTGEKK